MPTTAIMQPYFLPYLGYLNLMSSVDLFIVHDDVQYTKRGWINRNRFFDGAREVKFQVPLQKGSVESLISERSLSTSYQPNSLLRIFDNRYKRSENWDLHRSDINRILNSDHRNLADFLTSSLESLAETLSLECQIIRSSELDLPTNLRGQDRVLEICNLLGSDTYINPPGGKSLYDAETFRKRDIDLKFIMPLLSPYGSSQPFIPGQSVVDALAEATTEELQFAVHRNYSIVSTSSMEERT